ncbi:hypothetical protein PGB90_007201 [Kerria lacca]
MEVEIDIELLINLIQARHVFWDKEAAEYHDRIKSRGAWPEICATLHPEYEEIDNKKQKSICTGGMHSIHNVDHVTSMTFRTMALIVDIPSRNERYQLEFLRRLIGHRPTDDSIMTSVDDENRENSQDATVAEDAVEDDEIQEKLQSLPSLLSKETSKYDFSNMETMPIVLEKWKQSSSPCSTHQRNYAPELISTNVASINSLILDEIFNGSKLQKTDRSNYQSKQKIFSNNMEDELAKYLINCAKIYIRLSPRDVRRLEYDYACANERKRYESKKRLNVRALDDETTRWLYQRRLNIIEEKTPKSQTVKEEWPNTKNIIKIATNESLGMIQCRIPPKKLLNWDAEIQKLVREKQTEF